MAANNRTEPNKVQFIDASIAERIRRVMKRRHSEETPLATAARTLLHEYLLRLETSGDPAALTHAA